VRAVVVVQMGHVSEVPHSVVCNNEFDHQICEQRTITRTHAPSWQLRGCTATHGVGRVVERGREHVCH
jgi:hypothetical protein